MKYLVFNEQTMEFRYGSGLTVYSEKLAGGRLICTDYHAAGAHRPSSDRIAEMPVCAFQLEINGCDTTFGWSFGSWGEYEAEDSRPFGRLILKNTERELELEIDTFCGDNGYFTRQMKLRNLADREVVISRLSPLCGTLWETKEEVIEPLKDGELIPYTIGGYMDNWWGTEGNFNWRDVPYNTSLEFGCTSGRSGWTHPFAIAHNRVQGGYFICQMEWSSNWSFRFFNDFHHVAGRDSFLRLCFELCVSAKAPMRVVDPQEEVTFPAMHFGYTYELFDDAIHALHCYQRKYILARSSKGFEPIYSAHWGYEGWDMTPERLKIHIDRIADMGFEMFLVDAGWYGKPGSDWYRTVGDWQHERVLGGLKEIIDYTHSKGLLFGLWIEPEAIGPDSEASRIHPEWLIERYGERQERCLDLAKPEVEAWVEKQITDIIERYEIDLLRIDMNHDINEGGFNKRGEYNENTLWRHVDAVYRIFDHIRERFPDLLLENCAGGGGRTDLGMMRRFSRVQYTDWYKFPRCVRTFNGMSICLPPEVLLGATGPAMSLNLYGNAETQIQMMMQGCLYINPLAPAEEPVNEELSRCMKEYMTLYKNFVRPIQKDCKIYHHTPVVSGFQGRGWVVNEFVDENKTKAYATLFRLPNADASEWVFKPRGLDWSGKYNVILVGRGQSFCQSGYELSEKGITVKLDGALTSRMLLFHKV